MMWLETLMVTYNRCHICSSHPRVSELFTILYRLKEFMCAHSKFITELLVHQIR
jgi:hypothetical protein